jgi:hypothetical protein
LKKIKNLGFGGPGLKIHVPKENIFGVREFWHFGEMPEKYPERLATWIQKYFKKIRWNF